MNLRAKDLWLEIAKMAAVEPVLQRESIPQTYENKKLKYVTNQTHTFKYKTLSNRGYLHELL